MSKEKIPVYDICSLAKDRHSPSDFLIERFSSYLKRHPQNLHNAHRHSFFHLVLFTKGDGTHSIDFTKFPVKPFQIYFMIPGQVHSWHFKSDADGYIVNFSESFFRTFLLNPNYLERFNFFSGISEDSVCRIPPENQSKVLSLFEEMIAQFSTGKEVEPDMVKLLLLELFIVVDAGSISNHKKTIPQHKLTLLKSFRRLIDQHYRDIKLPKEYADLLYITPNHLNALCQDLLGKTAGELIRDRVLLEAKRLLTNAGMSITEIAYDLNFKDNSYFNRFFKKNVGITPDEFRNQFIPV
ncbi:AraC family transcriptional regulator [Chitinophagaceae bacterium LWZ2-11]